MFVGIIRTAPVALVAFMFALLLAGCRTPQPAPVASTESPSGPSTPEIVADELPDKPSDPPPPRDAADNMAPGLLEWDAVFKEYRAQPGETVAPFRFSLTNVSTEPITIYTTETTCDCTVAQMPSTPWRIPPGAGGVISADIDLREKRGTATNYVVVLTSKGNRLLSLKTFTPRAGTNLTTSAAAPAR